MFRCAGLLTGPSLSLQIALEVGLLAQLWRDRNDAHNRLSPTKLSPFSSLFFDFQQRDASLPLLLLPTEQTQRTGTQANNPRGQRWNVPTGPGVRSCQVGRLLASDDLNDVFVHAHLRPFLGVEDLGRGRRQVWGGWFSLSSLWLAICFAQRTQPLLLVLVEPVYFVAVDTEAVDVVPVVAALAVDHDPAHVVPGLLLLPAEAPNVLWLWVVRLGDESPLAALAYGELLDFLEARNAAPFQSLVDLALQALRLPSVPLSRRHAHPLPPPQGACGPRVQAVDIAR
mmetsp:Transcript_5383/g.9886  ORF Transcript_5383/g.9886 Transcript_5383/m.9886 type:complete len:284 (+) Transcript_5383:1481-2332(+)